MSDILNKTADGQQDLFADDHTHIGNLFDELDKLPDHEIAHKWPTTLTEIIDIVRSELVRQGENTDNAKRKAAKIVGLMAYYFGGKSIYLPTGEVIKDALRDVQIYNDFNGKNVEELIKKYKLSESHIYAILRKQRTLWRKRYQKELFE